MFGRDSENGVKLFTRHWIRRKMKHWDKDKVMDRSIGRARIKVRNRSDRRNPRSSIRRKHSDFKILSLKIK